MDIYMNLCVYKDIYIDEYIHVCMYLLTVGGPSVQQIETTGNGKIE